MKRFEDSDRYSYPDLTKESLVWDVGAHKGAFARVISEKYGSRIWCFEPIRSFYNELAKNVGFLPNVFCFRFGLAGTTRSEVFKVKGDMTGAWAEGPEEEVDLLDVAGQLTGVHSRVALLKINCEGGEYEILDRILALNIAPRFTNIQVQFHPISTDGEDPAEARDYIRSRLSVTHREMYCEPWVWEGWTLK
jgi:FkbM family methyltransferase